MLYNMLSSSTLLNFIKKIENWPNGFSQCKISGTATCVKPGSQECTVSYNFHENHDRVINCCINVKEPIFLYGIFTGLNGGSSVSDFISERLISYLSYEVTQSSMPEEQIKLILRQSFLEAENAYLESIDPKIAERAQLLEKISAVSSMSEAATLYPDTVSRLKDLEDELQVGATAVVSMVVGGQLYVGNVGNSKALLCQKDKSGVLRVKQLSQDHTTDNQEELDRLSRLSLNTDNIKGRLLGPSNVTRCFGNYFLKGAYGESQLLREASSEPVICEAHITSLPLDESCCFLLLVNHGLLEMLEQGTSSAHLNKDLVTMVVEQLMEQHDLTSVVEKVVERITNIGPRSTSKTDSSYSRFCSNSLSLILRNFTFRSPRWIEQISVPPLSNSTQFQADCQDSSEEYNSPMRDYETAALSTPQTVKEDSLCKPDTNSTCSDYMDGISGMNAFENFSNVTNNPLTSYSISQHQAPICQSNDPPQSLKASLDYPANLGYPETIVSSSENDGFNVNPSIDPIYSSSTESSKLSNPSLNQLTLDDEGRICPYVSFDEYYTLVDEAISSGVIQNSRVSIYK